MRKLIYFTMVSLDGFIDNPDKNLDWVSVDQEVHTFINDLERDKDAGLYGRRMYEIMRDFWPTADTPENPPEIIDYARIYNAQHKIVFSRTLEQVEGNARLVKGDAITEVARLKAEPGHDMGVGGSILAGALMQAGLVDEYHIFIQPVILGAGTPMIPVLDKRVNLRLMETKVFGSGVVFLRYEVTQINPDRPYSRDI